MCVHLVRPRPEADYRCAAARRETVSSASLDRRGGVGTSSTSGSAAGTPGDRGDLKLGQASRKLTNVRSLATEAMEAPRNSMTDEQTRLERELLGAASVDGGVGT